MRNYIAVFRKGLWRDHPIFRQLLGMCPTLAVTTSFVNGASMGFAVMFVLCSTSVVISLIRKIVPPQVRIATFTVVIATFVTVCDLFLKAFFPALVLMISAFSIAFSQEGESSVAGLDFDPSILL